MKRNLMLALPWFAVYENDGDGGGDGGGGGDQGGADAAAAKAAADKAAADKAAGGRTFTQAELNKFLADDRRKHQDQVKQTVAQLEELRTKVQLTESERTALAERIDTLNSSLMTAEEKAKQELSKKDKQLKETSESLSKERDKWKNEYTTEVITNQILRASTIHDAVSSDQLMDLLLPKTRLVEVLADGKVVGHAPKVKLKVPGDKGEAVELDLTVEESVKRMKELPELFGNLFKSGVKSGLGGNGSTGASTSGQSLTDLAKKDPATYRENRKKFGLGRGK